MKPTLNDCYRTMTKHHNTASQPAFLSQRHVELLRASLSRRNALCISKRHHRVEESYRKYHGSMTATAHGSSSDSLNTLVRLPEFASVQPAFDSPVSARSCRPDSVFSAGGSISPARKSVLSHIYYSEKPRPFQPARTAMRKSEVPRLRFAVPAGFSLCPPATDRQRKRNCFAITTRRAAQSPPQAKFHLHHQQQLSSQSGNKKPKPRVSRNALHLSAKTAQNRPAASLLSMMQTWDERNRGNAKPRRADNGEKKKKDLRVRLVPANFSVADVMSDLLRRKAEVVKSVSRAIAVSAHQGLRLGEDGGEDDYFYGD